MPKKKETHLYIFERISKKSWWAKVTLQNEVKIGITTNLEKRIKSVNKSTTGKVECTFSVKLKRAYKIEQRLHRLFDDSNFRMYGKGKSNGNTEWFYLSWLEFALLRVWIWYYRYSLILWVLLLSFSILGYILYIDFNKNHSRKIKIDGGVVIID